MATDTRSRSAPRHTRPSAVLAGLLLAFAAMLVSGHMVTGAAAQAAEDDGGFVTHKLALQVSDNDEAAMRSALDIAANVSRFYTAKAEEVEIRIVVYGPGIEMLRPARTPVMERLTSFEQSMPNVGFVACGNTLDTLEQAEGQRPEIVPFAEEVEAGVAELIRLDETGYTIVKP
ncbi:hypothetical protein VQ042_15840 [Aurantimonas sp. A2-1-M11]|uniref:DsrE family protein n=1 Tax=Aurantimonas sp. A2-1-M11 TaxID=3113712 RepID=UPI002F92DABD